ncbi:MAG: hypothetical protein GYA56_12150 [Geobacteraceae bacterium]|nr:hypothetical protein [Geobacteraceae bacterium]
MNYTEAVESILKNLDTWRHLPKYQLERRADMFFGLFVRDIVALHLNVALHRTVIPEFPFKNIRDRNTTVNFDYVLFSEDLRTAYILELKTDAGSVDDEQLGYLAQARGTKFSALLTGICDVAGKSSQDSKYRYLFRTLECLKLINSGRNMGDCTIEDVAILFLSPRLDGKSYDKVRKILDPCGNDDKNIISFGEAADLLDRKGGEMECHFAAYLRKWERYPAGSVSYE